jgi:cell wall-associated NlpC family hydrolase
MLDPRLPTDERRRLEALEVDWGNAWAGRLEAGVGAWPVEAAATAGLPALEAEGEGMILSPLEPLRDRPAHAAQQISELRQGERFLVLGGEGGWWLVAGEDGYVGWLRSWTSRLLARDEWAALLGRRRGRFGQAAGVLRDAQGRPLGPLYLGTPLLAAGATDRVALVDGSVGALSPDTLESRDPRGAPGDLASLAARLLGAPYRWGGRSAGGVDCSGLVQLSALLAGFDLPRDSAQQAGRGSAVDLSAGAWRRGDLLFFHDPVDHVGIHDGDGGLLHARGRVRRDRFEDLVELLDGLASVRRLCASDRSITSTLWRVVPSGSSS